MSTSLARTLVLEELSNGIPVIPEEAVGFYKQNCMVCFFTQNHSSGVIIDVNYERSQLQFEICWEGEVTPQIERAYRDKNKTTDFGACAIALLLIRELTELTAIEQSNVGTTIDYYLIRKTEYKDDTLIFNNSAYLEVSGIRCENENNTVEGRVEEKVHRLKKQEDLPTYISVVDFNRPWSKMVVV